MFYLIAFIAGVALSQAYNRGWLDTPIAAAVALVRNWGKK